MIVEIQENLKKIISDSTGLSADFIVTEEINTNLDKTFPWISIVPELADITQVWHRDPFFPIEDDSSIVVRKYNVVQSVKVSLEFNNKADLSQAVQNILVGLPKQIIIDKGIVSIEPQHIEYVFVKEEADPYQCTLTINMNYAVRETPVAFGRIKSIDTSINYELIQQK